LPLWLHRIASRDDFAPTKGRECSINPWHSRLSKHECSPNHPDGCAEASKLSRILLWVVGGEIQEKLDIPNSTLSHHLDKLKPSN